MRKFCKYPFVFVKSEIAGVRSLPFSVFPWRQQKCLSSQRSSRDVQRQLLSLCLGAREGVSKIHKTPDRHYVFLVTIAWVSVGVAKIIIPPFYHFSIKPSKKMRVGANTLKHRGEVGRLEKGSRTSLAPFFAVQRNGTRKLLFLSRPPLQSVTARKAT